MLRRQHYFLLGVAAVHVLAAIVLALLDGLGLNRSTSGEGTALGLAFGQATVLGVWAAWGPLRMAVRFPVACGWAIVVGFALVIKMGPPPNDFLFAVLLICGAMLVQMILVQLPLWVMRARHSLRMLAPTEQVAPLRRAEYQFGIRQLLILTTGVAVILALGRWIFSANNLEELAGNWESVIAVSIIVISNSLLTLPLTIGLLLPRRAWLGLLISLAFFATVTLLEQPVFAAILGRRGAPDEVFWWLNGIQYAWVLVSLLLVRAAGYRLLSRANQSPCGAGIIAASYACESAVD